jgi:AraC-like DNA-binding protein
MLLDAALRGTVLSLLLLLAAVLWRERAAASAAPALRAGVAMALGLAVQVVGATPWVERHVPAVWQAPLVAVAVANAVLFWVFVQALFDDDFVPRRIHALAWVGVAGLSGLNCLLHTGAGTPAALAGFGGWTLAVQRVLPLVFAALAMAAAARHWRGDLVEGRRRLRGFIVVSGVAYTVVQLALRLASPDGRLSTVGAGLDIVLTLAMVSTIAWRVLRLGATDLLPVARGPISAGTAASGNGAAPPSESARPEPAVPGPVAPDPADDRLADALDHAMARERLYRGEGLTIAGLAAHLDVPEYRLRRLINQRLGHRNFNAFVNAWRLQDTYDALADPARRDRPVLSIALDAGFQSIGPFNRAFKAATGLTPTEFRQQKLADS